MTWVLVLYLSCSGVGCTVVDRYPFPTEESCVAQLNNMKFTKSKENAAICIPMMKNKEGE